MRFRYVICTYKHTYTVYTHKFHFILIFTFISVFIFKFMFISISIFYVSVIYTCILDSICLHVYIYIYLYTFRGRYFSVHCLFHTKNGGHNRKENKHLWEKNTSRHRVKDFIQIEISPCEFSIVKLINDLQLKRVFWLGFKPGNQKKNKSSSQI